MKVLMMIPGMTMMMMMMMVVMMMMTTIVRSEDHILPGESGHNGTNHNNTHKKEDMDASSSFVRFLFRKYGRDEVMTFEGLEHLLNNIGLGHVTSFGHALQSHIDDEGNFVEFHVDHRHADELITKEDKHHHIKNNNHHIDDDDDDNDDDVDDDPGDEDVMKGISTNSTEAGRYQHVDAVVPAIEINKRLNLTDVNIPCLSAKEILKTFHIKYDTGIHTAQFLTLCPALVYQLDGHLCRSRSSNLSNNNESSHLNSWIGAFVAVGTISVTGFIIVGIIPWLANCRLYNNIIQFLISLAVGTLCADALLHLLPHAMTPHDSALHLHKEAGHDNHSVYVGLVTFSSILLFFIVERILKMFARRKVKSHRQHESKDIKNNNSMMPLEMEYLKSDKGIKFVKDGISSIEKLKELAIHHDDDHHVAHNRNPPQDHHHHTRDHHHHHHGHSHVIPSSIASVAWMVIMGDGLHNFTDGLAIGASFSSGIPIGMSTSVAVLCHELPHELGDFAVLLKSGMSMKQALLCNVLSSILCFLGACLGVAIGNMDSITSWVFSITAGIFIYIALVDMLPQLTSAYDSNPRNEDDMIESSNMGDDITHRCAKNDQLFYLMIHTIGLISGLSLMFVIALYEDSISINIY